MESGKEIDACQMGIHQTGEITCSEVHSCDPASPAKLKEWNLIVIGRKRFDNNRKKEPT